MKCDFCKKTVNKVVNLRGTDVEYLLDFSTSECYYCGNKECKYKSKYIMQFGGQHQFILNPNTIKKL